METPNETPKQKHGIEELKDFGTLGAEVYKAAREQGQDGFQWSDLTVFITNSNLRTAVIEAGRDADEVDDEIDDMSEEELAELGQHLVDEYRRALGMEA